MNNNPLSDMSIIKKSILLMSMAFFLLMIASAPAWGHVVVQPKQVGVATFQTFSVSVPTEKDIPTIALRLVLPADVTDVTPTVKPGWKISVKTNNDTETEISWTGGLIPAGQRDDFSFSTQAPAAPATLVWKAYQTYQDGSVVAWDQNPSNPEVNVNGEFVENTPYSETRVINDTTDAALPNPMDRGDQDEFALGISIGALLLAGLVCIMVWPGKNRSNPNKP